MTLDRRRFLSAALAATAAPLVLAAPSELLPAARGRRVVIVGGGWGGLTAARRLRELAPELEVVLLEKNAAFWSLPLSNKWLVGLIEEDFLRHDYPAAARAFGYTYIQAEVTAIDRERRQVRTARGAVGYDWLILAAGIGHHYGAWFGDDRRAADEARQKFPNAFAADGSHSALRRKLEEFRGGDLLMTIPPAPSRCPPAPYERAMMIGWWLKSRKIKGRLTVVDPGVAPMGFDRVFREHYADQITYLSQARIAAVDPFRRTVTTDFDDLRFDDAILMPPQRAGELVSQAGLTGADGWAAVDPVGLHVPGDERAFLIGDLLGKVSPDFGFFPKTGQLASRLGGIVARRIAAQAQGKAVERQAPDSVCYVYENIDPAETTKVETSYRLRVDGALVQSGRQSHDAQPRDEDRAWARGMFAEFLPPRGEGA